MPEKHSPVPKHWVANALGVSSAILATAFWIQLVLPPSAGPDISLELAVWILSGSFVTAMAAGCLGSKLWFIGGVIPLLEAGFFWSLRT